MEVAKSFIGEGFDFPTIKEVIPPSDTIDMFSEPVFIYRLIEVENTALCMAGSL